MKKTFNQLAIAVMLFFAASCGTNEGNMTTMGIMKDSIFAAYPTIAAVTINVENDNNLIIAIGSQDYYGADEYARQKLAAELAQMANRLFGKDNKLEHGKIMVTANEMNNEPQPADALVSQMDFVTIKRQ